MFWLYFFKRILFIFLLNNIDIDIFTRIRTFSRVWYINVFQSNFYYLYLCHLFQLIFLLFPTPDPPHYFNAIYGWFFIDFLTLLPSLLTALLNCPSRFIGYYAVFFLLCFIQHLMYVVICVDRLWFFCIFILCFVVCHLCLPTDTCKR